MQHACRTRKTNSPFKQQFQHNTFIKYILLFAFTPVYDQTEYENLQIKKLKKKKRQWNDWILRGTLCPSYTKYNAIREIKRRNTPGPNGNGTQPWMNYFMSGHNQHKILSRIILLRF